QPAACNLTSTSPENGSEGRRRAYSKPGRLASGCANFSWRRRLAARSCNRRVACCHEAASGTTTLSFPEVPPMFARSIAWLLCAGFISINAGRAKEKAKPLAVEDLYLMESVKSPTLFPKEEKLVYERVWIDAKTKEERHSLWLVTEKRENRKPLE